MGTAPSHPNSWILVQEGMAASPCWRRAYMGGLCRGPPGHPWVPSVGFGEQPQSPAQGDRTKGGWGVAPLLSAAKPQPGGARWGALLIAALEIVLNYDKRHPLCGLLTLRFNAPVADLRAPAPCSPGSPAPAPRGATRDGSSGRGDTTNTAASPSFHSIQRNVPPPWGEAHPGQLRGGTGCCCCCPSSQSRG